MASAGIQVHFLSGESEILGSIWTIGTQPAGNMETSRSLASIVVKPRLRTI